MRIVSRAEWGFTGWTSQPASVPLSERAEFYIHYDGAAHINITGDQVPRRIDEEHKGNSWSGIGYHFVVDQAGTVFEGRGWDLQGAHCPGHNRSAFGVQIAIGGDQQPTAAALNAAVDLYEEACRRTGRQLSKHGHRDGFNTDCPGGQLYPWVQAGMPRPNNQEDDVLSDDDVRKLLNTKLGDQYAVTDQWGGTFVPTVADALNGAAYATSKAEQALTAVQALTAKTGTGAGATGGVTQAQLDAAAAAGAKAALAPLAATLAQIAAALAPKGN